MSGLAGALKARVTLARPDGVRDVLGGIGGSWVEAGEAWAAIAPAGHDDARPLWRVTMRTRSLAVGWRMTWAGRAMRVIRVEADPRLPDRIAAVAREDGE